MNSDLFWEVMGTQCPSGNHACLKRMRKFIRRRLPHGCVATTDSRGNLLVTKGKAEVYPCVVAHMDQVHDERDSFVVYVVDDRWVMAFDTDRGEQVGCGGDDKVGIFAALECLHKVPAIKAAFFVDEERGCVGSNAVNLSFFKDCGFIMQADRHIENGNEIITETNGVISSSDGFLKALIALGTPGDWKEGEGTCTDVGALAKRGAGVACVNVGAAYLHHHTSREVVSLPHLEQTIALMTGACEKLGSTRFEHVATSMYRGFGFGGGSNGYSHEGGWASPGGFYKGPHYYYTDDYDDGYDGFGKQPHHKEPSYSQSSSYPEGVYSPSEKTWWNKLPKSMRPACRLLLSEGFSPSELEGESLDSLMSLIDSEEIALMRMDPTSQDLVRSMKRAFSGFGIELQVNHSVKCPVSLYQTGEKSGSLVLVYNGSIRGASDYLDCLQNQKQR